MIDECNFVAEIRFTSWKRQFSLFLFLFIDSESRGSLVWSISDKFDILSVSVQVPWSCIAGEYLTQPKWANSLELLSGNLLQKAIDFY